VSVKSAHTNQVVNDGIRLSRDKFGQDDPTNHDNHTDRHDALGETPQATMNVKVATDMKLMEVDRDGRGLLHESGEEHESQSANEENQPSRLRANTAIKRNSPTIARESNSSQTPREQDTMGKPTTRTSKSAKRSAASKDPEHDSTEEDLVMSNDDESEDDQATTKTPKKKKSKSTSTSVTKSPPKAPVELSVDTKTMYKNNYMVAGRCETDAMMEEYENPHYTPPDCVLVYKEDGIYPGNKVDGIGFCKPYVPIEPTHVMEVKQGDAEGYLFPSNEPSNKYVNKLMGYSIKHWATTEKCTPQEAITKVLRDEVSYLAQLSGIPMNHYPNRIIFVVYKIFTEFNNRHHVQNMAIGYIAQYFMKLRLGIIPTKYGSLKAFKLACDNYYTHKFIHKTTTGSEGQLQSAGSAWKILILLVVNDHLEYHGIPKIPFCAVKTEDVKLIAERSEINSVGVNDDVIQWAVTESRAEVKSLYHGYIEHYAEKVKELRKHDAQEFAARVNEAKDGNESEDCM
jgi:hypothetical protein